MNARTVAADSRDKTVQSTWVTILGGLALLGPLSVDAYLPAFSIIERDFVAAPEEVQFTLTGYMLAYAGMSLFHGALSDALGRRRVILASLAAFAFAALGCAVAPSLGSLSLFRIIQGLSAGAGTVVGRAIILDQFEGAAAARLLAIVSMVFTLSPALAPVLGGWIVERTSWRTIFLSLFGYATVLLLFCLCKLPETLPLTARQAFRPAELLRQYGNVFLHRSFSMGALAIGLGFAGLFVYIASAPAFLGQEQGGLPTAYAWMFVPIVAGIFLGSWSAERLVIRVQPETVIASGFVIQMITVAANSAFHVWHSAALPYSLLPLFFYAFGMSLATPGLMLAGLDLFPTLRGMAASCQAFAMVALAGVATHVAPHLNGRVHVLALTQGLLCLAAFVTWRVARQATRALNH